MTKKAILQKKLNQIEAICLNIREFMCDYDKVSFRVVKTDNYVMVLGDLMLVSLLIPLFSSTRVSCCIFQDGFDLSQSETCVTIKPYTDR